MEVLQEAGAAGRMRSDRGSPWNLYFAARAKERGCYPISRVPLGVISGMTCGHWMSSFMMGCLIPGMQNEGSFF